jgi:hypothetical protein
MLGQANANLSDRVSIADVDEDNAAQTGLRAL